MIMRELFFEAVGDKTFLDKVYREVERILREVRGQYGHLGYVAGIISSDGPEHQARNFQNLEVHTRQLQAQLAYPIFSATEIFWPGHLASLQKNGIVKEGFIKFWRSVLSSGYVTDVFLSPRWDESEGALDEHKIAKLQGLRVYYLDQDKILL